MLHSSSSSGGTCYEKLMLDMPSCRFFVSENIMPTFEVGSRKHIKNTSTGYVLRVSTPSDPVKIWKLAIGSK